MASVWAAEDELLQRLVAVKVLAPGYAAEPAARRRFTREARAAARVSDHPHVVTVYDIGESQADPPEAFIVMEHFAGGTVADRLRTGQPVPVPTALEWLEQAASAIDAAHAAEVVHRDVKPGNLLLDERGRLAVGDFGIASLAGETALTQVGEVLGTAAYLSPEQARGEPATPASDRYALAVVAYELLCGKRPFSGETPLATARAHVEAEPPTPTGPCDSAAHVLTGGLEKDPARRPPTATMFVQELRDALGPKGSAHRAVPAGEVTHRLPVVAAAPQATRATPHTPPARPVRRAPSPVGAAAHRSTAVPSPEPLGRPRSTGRRFWPVATLAAVCLGGGAAAALLSGGGDVTGNRTTTSPSAGSANAGQRRHTTSAPATASAAAPATPAPQSQAAVTQPPAAAPDGRSPGQLNDAGFARLPADAAGALPLLQAAVDRFRAAGAQGDINYAYALYNLGWALRLSGRPADAIPYLEERLQISDYKRGLVQQELLRARQGATGDSASGNAALGGYGNRRGKDHGRGNGGQGSGEQDEG
jgi:serine/threonine-protein kinase